MAQLVETSSVRPAGAATIVAMGLAVAMLEGYDIQAMGVAAPKMIPALGLSPSEAGWVFGASMMGLVLGAVVGGWLADRIGRKPILIGSVIAFGLFSLATMVAGDYVSLFAVRVLTGLGLGGAVPNLIAVANEISARGRRTITTTAMFCGMPLGGGLSAVLAQAILPSHDWRLIFLVGGLLPLAAAPAILFLLPETGLIRRSEGAEPPRILALFDGNRILVTPLLWAGFVLTLIVLYLLLNWFPSLAVAKGLPPSSASITSLAYNFGSVPGALVLGWMVDRWGIRLPMIVAYGGAALVLVGLAWSSSYWAIAVLSGLAGATIVASLYVLYAVAPVYYPPTMRGTGAGAAVAVGRFGSIAGPIIAGQLLAAGLTANQVVLVLVPVSLAAGAAVILMSWVARPEE